MADLVYILQLIIVIMVLYMIMRMLYNDTDLYKRHNQDLIYNRMDAVEHDLLILTRLMDVFQKDLEDKEEYVSRRIYDNDISDLRNRMFMLEKD